MAHDLQGYPHKAIVHFSAETVLDGIQWKDIFKVLKRITNNNYNNFQPGIYLLEKLSFINKAEIKTPSDKQNLKEFTTTRPALYNAKRSSSS